MSRRDIVRKLMTYARFPSDIHGPAHWSRVRRFGALLGEGEALPDAARACVEIFAWVHDLAREHDGGGNEHAIDGAVYIDRVVPAVFGVLLPDQMETLRTAIRYHSDGMTAQQAFAADLLPQVAWDAEVLVATVGCCWDADRLDLPRVGIVPDARFMSTASWRHAQRSVLVAGYETSEDEEED
jgi:uncharacterized protein